jgi:hypothetical protein
MSSLRPKIVFAASAVTLIGVAVGLSHRASADPRVGLVGPVVRHDANSSGRPDLAVFKQFWVRGAGGMDRPFRVATPVRQIPAEPLARPKLIRILSMPAAPRRIVIRTIGVDAIIDAVGLKPDGSMAIPDAANAGWYHYGATPGQSVGSAVIAGHVDHQQSPGVFLDLPRLAVGAEIVVTDADGVARRFVVTERYQVSKDALPAPELFRLSGDPTLTLITCGGRFDRSRRHYDDNIVIRAVPQLDTARLR